jgi:hypothetical protein
MQLALMLHSANQVKLHAPFVPVVPIEALAEVRLLNSSPPDRLAARPCPPRSHAIAPTAWPGAQPSAVGASGAIAERPSQCLEAVQTHVSAGRTEDAAPLSAVASDTPAPNTELHVSSDGRPSTGASFFGFTAAARPASSEAAGDAAACGRTDGADAVHPARTADKTDSGAAGTEHLAGLLKVLRGASTTRQGGAPARERRGGWRGRLARV